MFFSRKSRIPEQEIIPFNSNQYDQLLSEEDRVILEDLKVEALSKTLGDEQQQEVLRISEQLAVSAAEAGLPASSETIARFIREFYQSMAAAEQSKNVEINSERFDEFTSLLHEDELRAFQEISSGVEQYGTLSPENINRIKRYKQHYVDAVSKARRNFTKEEVESYIDTLVAPRTKESVSVEHEPQAEYIVQRPSSVGVDLPPSRFDDPNVKPKEDLR